MYKMNTFIDGVRHYISNSKGKLRWKFSLLARTKYCDCFISFNIFQYRAIYSAIYTEVSHRTHFGTF